MAHLAPSYHDEHSDMDIDDDTYLESVTNSILDCRKRDPPGNEFADPTWEAMFRTPPHNQEVEDIIAVAVVDTNWLISHQILLENIVSAMPEGCHLVVPFVVLQELDKLKSSTEANARLAERAVRATRYLHDSLENRSSSIRGQKVFEYLEQNAPGDAPDDRILDCVRFQQLFRSCNVTLLSDDLNLCVKARVHGIATVSKPSADAQGILSFILNPPVPPLHCQSPSFQEREAQQYVLDDDEEMTEAVPETSSNRGSILNATEFCELGIPLHNDINNRPSSAPKFSLRTPHGRALSDSIHAPKNASRTGSGGVGRSRSTNYDRRTEPGLFSYSDIPMHHAKPSEQMHIDPSPIMSSHSGRQGSLNDSIHAPSKYRQASHPPSLTPSSFATSSQKTFLEPSLELSKPPDQPVDQARCVALLRTILTKLEDDLPSAFERIFESELGPEWSYVVKLKRKPWHLRDVLQMVEPYWFTVFESHYGGSRSRRDVLARFERIRKVHSEIVLRFQTGSPWTRKRVEEIIGDAEVLLMAADAGEMKMVDWARGMRSTLTYIIS